MSIESGSSALTASLEEHRACQRTINTAIVTDPHWDFEGFDDNESKLSHATEKMAQRGFRAITADEFYAMLQKDESNSARTTGSIKLWKILETNDHKRVSDLRIVVPDSNSATYSDIQFSTMTHSCGAVVTESEFSTETAVDIYQNTMWRMSQGSK